MSREETKLYNELINLGVNTTGADFQHGLAEAKRNASAELEPPPSAAEDQMPERMREIRDMLRSLGRVGTVLIVSSIQGVFAPILTLIVIIADAVRLMAVIRVFETNGVIAGLLAFSTVMMYVAMCLRRADLKYTLRKKMGAAPSFVQFWNNALHFFGWVKDWQPVQRSQNEQDLKQATRLVSWFKTGLLVMFILHGLAIVAEGIPSPQQDGVNSAQMNNAPETLAEAMDNIKISILSMPVSQAADLIVGALASVLVSGLLVLALDALIERSHRIYMTEAGGQSVITPDFLEEAHREFALVVSRAEQNATIQYLKLVKAQVISQIEEAKRLTSGE